MDKKTMAIFLRERASIMNDNASEFDQNRAEIQDNAELINVLARIIEGKPIEIAFGAPGDWGYSNPIGKILAS